MDYLLKNPLTGKILDDTIDRNKGFVLSDPDSPQDVLLQTEYPSLPTYKQGKMGFYGLTWLPVVRSFENKSGPVHFEHKKFAQKLGLPNLSIVFSGFSSRYNANNISGTFKEFEALGVLGRLADSNIQALVLSSAGNTARAFISLYSSVQDPAYFPYRLILVVPDYAINELWSPYKKDPRITLVALKNGDYTDAILLANNISERNGYVNEGGVKNVGRRDGMASTYLSYYLDKGHIPDHYFQAVGSASGAIAAWENSKKLALFGIQKKNSEKDSFSEYTKLHISQNAALAPLVWAWQKKETDILSLEEQDFKERIASCYSKVLTNRTPPYAIKGGVYDACKESQAQAYGVTWNEADAARELFLEEIGIEICSSSAVCFASLLSAKNKGTIASNDNILLNITGGGFDELKKKLDTEQVVPDLVIDASSDLTTKINQQKTIDKIILYGEYK